MIALLKVILGIFLGLVLFVGRYIFIDLRATKKTQGYEESSIWQRFIMSLVFYVMIGALLSMCVFLVYFIIIPLSLG